MRRLVFLLVLGTMIGRSPSVWAEKPIVAVLYFDNNTSDPSLDVLKKGLADMMVTDLASVDDITVVERDRLEDVLAELALQKSRYFDKKTAVKIGKGLGAKYAVTGAIAAMAPQVRLDIRLIEIATSKVVVADRITGQRERFFELQKQLAEKFIGGIDSRLRYRPNLGLKVPDVDTLMSYAEGVDLADQGRVDEAKAHLRAIVKRRPTFGLARQKISALEANLNKAKVRRTDARADAAIKLQRMAETFLAKHKLDALDKDTTETYLAYRATKGAFILRALRGVLSPAEPHLVLPENRARALPLIRAYVANTETLLDEYDRAAARHQYLSIDLDAAGSALADAFDMKTRMSFIVDRADETLAEFLLLGRGNTLADKDGRFTMAPPPSVLEPRFEAVGFRLIKRARGRGNDYDRGRTAELLADVHALRAETEQAVGALQSVLDEFPTHKRYKFFEKRIQELLGMKRDHTLAKRARYADALDRCDDMDMRIGVPAELDRRMRLAGIDAVPAVIDEVIAKCKKTPRLESVWQYVFERGASIAGENEVCDLYEDMMRRFLASGGHSTSAHRHWERHGPKCTDVSATTTLPVCWMIDPSGMKPARGFQEIRKGLMALGTQTAPKGAWFHERGWFGLMHPRQDKSAWAKCRAIVRIDVQGTPDRASARVSVVKGPKQKPVKISLGDIRKLRDDPSPLAPAWTEVAWKLYPPKSR